MLPITSILEIATNTTLSESADEKPPTVITLQHHAFRQSDNWRACTTCGREFIGTPAKIHADAILKIKADFAEHKCKNAEAGKSNGGGSNSGSPPWVC